MALVLGFAEKTQILVGNVSRSLELNERLDKKREDSQGFG